MLEKLPVEGPNEVRANEHSVLLSDSYLVVFASEYSVNFAAPSQALTDMMERTLHAGKAKLVSPMPISLGIYPGIQFETKGPSPARARIRYYIVGRRLYQLGYAVPLDRSFPQEADRFFSVVPSPKRLAVTKYGHPSLLGASRGQ